MATKKQTAARTIAKKSKVATKSSIKKAPAKKPATKKVDMKAAVKKTNAKDSKAAAKKVGTKKVGAKKVGAKVPVGHKDHWFSKKSKTSQAAYIKSHPNSKLAKNAKAGKLDVKAAPSEKKPVDAARAKLIAEHLKKRGGELKKTLGNHERDAEAAKKKIAKHQDAAKNTKDKDKKLAHMRIVNEHKNVFKLANKAAKDTKKILKQHGKIPAKLGVKPAAKKSVAKKATAVKKPAVKKAVAKKPVAKKAVKKTATLKKPVAKKTSKK